MIHYIVTKERILLINTLLQRIHDGDTKAIKDLIILFQPLIIIVPSACLKISTVMANWCFFATCQVTCLSMLFLG